MFRPGRFDRSTDRTDRIKGIKVLNAMMPAKRILAEPAGSWGTNCQDRCRTRPPPVASATRASLVYAPSHPSLQQFRLRRCAAVSLGGLALSIAIEYK